MCNRKEGKDSWKAAPRTGRILAGHATGLWKVLRICSVHGAERGGVLGNRGRSETD